MPQAQPFASTFPPLLTSVIAAGASVAANGVSLNNNTLVGIIIPTGWTAAVVGFSVSADGVNYSPLFDSSGNEVSVTNNAANNPQVYLDPSIFAGVAFLKIRSGTVAAPVNQTVQVSVTLITRPVT